jgi:hypothetical protein
MSPGRNKSRCDINAPVSTPPMWHMIFAPVPDFSHAKMARLSGSVPCLAMTFSDMRTLAPSAISAFSPIVLAQASTCAKSML